MSCDRLIKGLKSHLVWCLLFFSVLLAGCVAGQQKQGNVLPQGEPSEPCMVQAITVSTQELPLVVDILANRKLTYTSLKQSFPLGISVYLPETAIDDSLLAPMPLESDILSSITASYADEDRKTALITLFLKKNVNYEVVEREQGLRLKLSGINPGNRAEEPPMVSNTVNASGNSSSLSSSSNSNEPDGSVEDSGLKPDADSAAESPAVEISDKPALLTGIGFNTDEEGRSKVAIRTSHAVKYEIRKTGEDRVEVKLNNTDIPEYRRRPLDTTYFNSAVKSVIPIEVKPGEKASTIAVLLREEVPYQVYREGASLIVDFDAAVGISPPEFVGAKVSLASGRQQPEMLLGGTLPAGIIADSGSSDDAQGGGGDRESEVSDTEEPLNPAALKKKTYTGEKIRLDFFETDIKNVFRILRSVSGNNFAVDKDVSGNVTLTLDKPVPWDQVMDLVLKMNGLGQTQEGSIIRIATLETLKREAELRQASIAAIQASIEQKKSLEPLFTEYIPINYSSAESDIKPHVEKIVTPERGHISVDTRTNMIIMTDTREKIDQAKELIYRLDKVTPQIMIEARVVEVSKDFSKELGISWGMATDGAYRDDLGGDYGFNVAMNYPVASTSSLSYTFSRITGTPFALNAHLTASETKGDVRIISSPRILTLDNKKAKIKQGLEYAYLERDDSGGSSVKFKNIDLLLEVTPHVTPDARIAMSVYITKNDIDSVTDGIPSLSTNEAETELLVNDGNTIVIGGIVKSSATKGKTGFPGLVNLPVLGKLFGSNTKKEKKNELLIFITPTIVQLEQRQNNG